MAADEIFGLNTNDVSILRQLINWWRSYRKETAPPRQPQQQIRWTLIGYAPGGLDAASGDITSGGGLTPGIGDVQPCYFDPVGGVWLATDGATMEAHNLSSSPVAANVPLQFKKINGYWVVDFEEC